ncbi:TetR/AcrR family transcriptional regulator [Brevibacterium sp. CSND-B09]|uniref:TetR/AcrR family transcriptional regulator n=1 Tax=Brevibacterium sp. CSND-B09 TaxID=3462571 RepID=UPI00406A5B86
MSALPRDAAPTAVDYYSGGQTTYLSKAPEQKRAQVTFNRIVSAAVGLLLERGLTALNTNAVAEGAGVNVASVYSYFRNKESILYFLAEFYEGSRVALVASGAERIRNGADWKQTVAEIIDAMVDFRIAHPGCVVVRNAVASVPDSPDFDAASTREAAESLTECFLRLSPTSSLQTLRKVTLFFADTVTVTVDRAFATMPHDAQAIAYLKEMSEAWLSTYIDAP